MPPRIKGSSKRLMPWLVPLLLVVCWQYLSWIGIIPKRVLPAPLEVLQAAMALLSTGELYHHIMVSLGRALAGFLIGGTIGFLLGLSNGISKFSELLFDTSVQMLRNIPHLALIPLVILWFGIDETSKIFLVALGVLFPIYINTYHGIKNVDKDLIEMGKAYGLKGKSLFLAVILP